MKKYNVAVIGASGAVGEELFLVLEEQKFPVGEIYAFASKNSVGKSVEYRGDEIIVDELKEDTFTTCRVDIAFFCATSEISCKYAPLAAKSGALVIDNTSEFRNDDDIALIVPTCNAKDIQKAKNKNIISNPNCSTIQMVQILKPLNDQNKIKRVDVSTYQAVSGAGKRGMEELINQLKDFFSFNLSNTKKEVFKHQIAFNAIPAIGDANSNGYTKEELKMVNESKKILNNDIHVNATCVRVPIIRSHSMSLTITFKNSMDAKDAKEILKNTQNIEIFDDIDNNIYPMPIQASDKDTIHVGRIRNDMCDKNILNLWCCADQLRVGAASNAVHIAQEWIKLQK